MRKMVQIDKKHTQDMQYSLYKKGQMLGESNFFNGRRCPLTGQRG